MQLDRDSAHLWDILDAARTITQFISDANSESYLVDRKLQLAVERLLEIIGEAAGKISRDFKQAHSEIPWREMIGQRNILAHEYGRIEQQRIWSTVTTDIPELIKMIEPLIPPLP